MKSKESSEVVAIVCGLAIISIIVISVIGKLIMSNL